ncbi:FAD-binding oxidoreductase [Kribbella sp. NPDC026596]|uniref:FAD-binding oxidoreductase n=1 Tax=Kribbella sp. NPDC026596 TaxID=3155122 RepID=UPI0033D49C7E
MTVRWERLAASLQGALLLPGTIEYDEAAKTARPRPTAPCPQAIVQAASAGDVATAIRFGRDQGIRTVPRGGGHCYAGRSTTAGLLIDVGPMDRVELAGTLVTVGAGARLGGIYDVLAPAGRMLPAGTCPTVGISGQVLGGGFGFLGRAYGLACDYLVSAELVLADGSIVRCDATHDADLFWALRGAGGSQLGVLTNLVFDTVPLPPVMTSFDLTWAYDHAAAVTTAYQRWAPSAPDEYDLDLRLFVPADPVRPPEVHLFGSMLGTGPLDVVTDIVAAIGVEPHWVFHEHGDYLGEVERLETVGPGYSPDSTKPRFVKSEFFRESMPPAAIRELVARLTADRVPGQIREFSFSPWGGGYNRVPTEATAFAHREEAFLLEHSVEVEDATAPDWLDEAWQFTHQWGSGRVYPNFPDAGLTDWESAYHGPNLGRLREVKRRYDPDNWFRFHQSVPPAEDTN